MKILSKIQRRGGTRVTMGDKDYHFAPIEPDNMQSPHVASVTEKEHISRFLSVPEGFEYFGEDDAPDEVRTELTKLSDPVDNPDAPGAAGQPQEPVQDPAPNDPDAEDETEDEGSEGEDALLAVLNAPEDVTRETAEMAFNFLFERKPNANAKTETVIKKIIEQSAASGWLAEGNDAPLLERLATADS